MKEGRSVVERAKSALPVTRTEWLAPESWGRSLVGVAKSMVVFGTVFWTGMSLMGAPVSLRQTGLTALFISSMQLFSRRTGGAMPAAPALILGAVTITAAAAAAVVAVVTGRAETLAFSAIGGFLGGLLLWFGFRSRTREKQLAGSVATERVAPVLVPSAELGRRVAEYRALQAPKGRRMMWWMVGGGATFMGIFAVPSLIAPAYEPPEWVGALLFFGMWGIALHGLRNVTRRERADAEHHGLVCPACDRSYFSMFGNTRLMKVIEEAGCCPQCGARIVTEEHA